MNIIPKKSIGECVYRKWTDWYEPYFVQKITEKQVWVQGLMEDHCIILKRGVLERTGSCCSWSHRAVFVIDMPEEYRRTTIGYLMAREPRKILGLSESFTQEELKNAFRKLAMETHPDRGGNEKDYIAVQKAYEHLKGV